MGANYLLTEKGMLSSIPVNEKASQRAALKAVIETKKGVRQTDSFQVAQLGTDTSNCNHSYCTHSLIHI